MADVSIKIADLGKRYDIYESPLRRLGDLLLGTRVGGRPFWALKGVNLGVRRGETVGIIGRNGSGKSTLLQIICGTLEPTEGQVHVRGRVAALLELGAGFNPEFTGRENVRLNAAILGLSPEQIEARLPDIIEFAEIDEFIDQPVKFYSSGMFLRLAFAVIAHVDADILVVDEALAVGDVVFVQKCMRFLRRFQEQGILLFVSHEPGMVTSLCDRAVWLDCGEVQRSGPAAEVTEAYIEHIYASRQGEARPNEQKARVAAPSNAMVTDVRREALRQSNLRNQFQIFAFDPSAAGFGTGEAQVLDVRLVGELGQALTTVEGGESAQLEIHWRANRDMAQPIVGFMIKDRLGQFLFGENTYLSTQLEPFTVLAGQSVRTRFGFRMPYLATGDYALTVALAEGTQEEHVQHQWLHEALVLHVQASHVVNGLFGIPMERIDMTIVNDRDDAGIVDED